MDYLEIVGASIGVVYLWLEYRASTWLWVVSTIMPAIYLVVFYRAGLYADFGINLYYLLASIYGLMCWLTGTNKGGKVTEIHRMPTCLWPITSVIAAVLFILIGYILEVFTDSTVPWADGFTTALSIVAMWMLARKYLEQWLVWIVADVACCLLYGYKDLWFTAVLYGAYAIIAIAGYRKWKSFMNHEENND